MKTDLLSMAPNYRKLENRIISFCTDPFGA
jgi:hypothetical protein